MLYKVSPAIVSSISDKIEIQLAGGRTKRVRDKDVTLLHPGPLTSLGALEPGDPAIDEMPFSETLGATAPEALQAV